MDITEIRIKLVESSEDRLRAFCSITIDDCFVVRDLKIIDGASGPFVAMPSRKLTGHCPRCNHKNHLRAAYCNHCGAKLKAGGETQFESPQKLYADVAHPINSECREEIQSAVINEFDAEIRRAAQPGYRSRYDDDFVDAGPESDNLPADQIRNETTGTASRKNAGTSADVEAEKSSADRAKSTQTESVRSEAGPPRPHFLDGPKKRGAAPLQQDSDNDADHENDYFGKGIF